MKIIKSIKLINIKMENIFMNNLNNQIYANNNNLLLDVINRLENLIYVTKDKVIIPRIRDIIIIINKITNNCNQIRKDIENLNNNINEKFQNLELNLRNNPNINENINNNNFQIKNYNEGRYEGQLINGKKEGKGTFYYINGGKYEGDWKNDMKEGKGIDYIIW